MEYRPLDVTVISAKDLKDVNLMSTMDVYVVVSVAGDPQTMRKTPVHKDGGKNPKWNHRLNFSVADAAISHQPNLCLLFKLRSDRPLGDKDIGDVSVPIKELLDRGDSGEEKTVEYPVRTTSGKPKGTLKFSYKFGEKITAATTPYAAAASPYVPDKSKSGYEPVTAYPAHPSASTAYPSQPGVGYAAAAPYPYPQPQQGYGYPPPPHGYGAPPPGYGGYPPPYGGGYGHHPPPPMVQQAQPVKNKKSSKLGLGLGAGLLGGLLVGDMMSDVGEMAAYDAGFDDGADFDF